jgi:hypothetical protein
MVLMQEPKAIHKILSTQVKLTAEPGFPMDWLVPIYSTQ